MIIVPNQYTRKKLNHYPNTPIVILSHFIQDLMEKTDCMIANQFIIQFLLKSHAKDPQIQSHINFILLHGLFEKHDDLNFQWIQSITKTLQQDLKTYNLIHPKDIYAFLTKENLDLPYENISHFGFSNPPKTLVEFFSHYNMTEIPSVDHQPTHTAYQFSNKREEVQQALKWVSEQEDAALVCLDSSYKPILSLESFDHDQSFIKYITQPYLNLPSALINYFQLNHHPKGLNLLRYLSRSEYAKAYTFIPYFSIHHPLQISANPIPVETFINIITDICTDWHVPLPKEIQSLQSLSYLDAKLSYQDWYNLYQTSSTSNLGPERLEGALLSHLWILGAQQDNWKKRTSLKWIPLSLQKESNFHYLNTAANHIVHSSLCQDDHEKPLKLLINNLSSNSIRTIETERYSSEDTIALEDIHPSTTLLTDYATCPFKAFSTQRLALEPKTQASHDPDKRSLGSLIHNALEYLYQNITTQTDLDSITQDALTHVIDKALSKYPFITPKHLIPILKTSLYLRLEKWIEKDKQREDFTISSLEEKRQLNLGKYTLNLRIDRIDHSNNQTILIDYKTSSFHINESLDPSLSSPQMILYALTESNPCQIAYAKPLKNPVWQSINLEKLDDYSELVNTWKQSFIHSLKQFQAGLYPVSPFSPKACTHCAFKSFCRIGEQHAH